MLASFMLLVDFNAISWEGVKFRGRACQRRDNNDTRRDPITSHPVPVGLSDKRS